jgi:hypothetical protein
MFSALWEELAHVLYFLFSGRRMASFVHAFLGRVDARWTNYLQGEKSAF